MADEIKEVNEEVNESVNDQGDANPEEKTVPLSALEKVREENSDLKQNLSLMQGQLNQMQNQMANSQPQDTQDTTQDDEDVMTRGEVKALMASQQGQTSNVMSEMAMRVQHNDYDEVINTNLQNVIKTKPYLLEAIKTSSSPHALAYELGMTDPAYKKDGEQNAQRIIKNQQKPGSVNQVSSNSGGTTLDSAFANMPTEDFEKVVDNVLSGR